MFSFDPYINFQLYNDIHEFDKAQPQCLKNIYSEKVYFDHIVNLIQWHKQYQLKIYNNGVNKLNCHKYL